MSQVVKLTFGPIMENTFIIYDETSECVIVDPGCSDAREREALIAEISRLQLKPVRLLNTHCHVDHIPGNPLIANTYGIGLEIHPLEEPVLADAPNFADMFGIEMDAMPPVIGYLNEGDEVKFGNTVLKVLFTPGHSPGSISFYNPTDKYVISGDVLFYQSIGRYDLPGANGAVLYQTLTNVMMNLPDDTRVYCGHGRDTSIGVERSHNPYLRMKSLP
ncbi:MAG: MBL fold metallo-hydrolase [Bacteroidetes bacterium]|nr:MBL fold metallo-hydrolase [Bacteroidota bacterium]